jgi:hypothetical protein
LEVRLSGRFSWLGGGLEAMKASRFMDAQKAYIIRQDEEGTPVAGLPEGGDQPADLLQLE